MGAIFEEVKLQHFITLYLKYFCNEVFEVSYRSHSVPGRVPLACVPCPCRSCPSGPALGASVLRRYHSHPLAWIRSSSCPRTVLAPPAGDIAAAANMSWKEKAKLL